MKNYRIKFKFVVIALLVGGCASPWKDLLISKGNHEDAIQNAVTDFLNTSPLRKNDTIFHIMMKEINNGILGISISGSTQKPYIVKDGNSITYKYLPTGYLEKQGKLFFWYDSTKVVTPNIIKVFEKYQHIDTAILNVYYPTHFNHSKKSEDYYFCINNLKKYKKVRTRVAMGYYEPPKLRCN